MTRLINVSEEDLISGKRTEEFKKEVVKMNSLLIEMLALNFPDGVHGFVILTVLMHHLRDVATEMNIPKNQLLTMIKEIYK